MHLLRFQLIIYFQDFSMYIYAYFVFFKYVLVNFKLFSINYLKNIVNNNNLKSTFHRNIFNYNSHLYFYMFVL